MRYGLPYKGSKNGIAKKIVALFPPAANFYDLFAGGGAVTHCSLLSGKFKNHCMNDIDGEMINLFKDAVSGKFTNENRWISREDFSRLKDSDKYVAICWSFGNKGDGYLYGKEVEPWKKALHYARIFGDKSLLQEFGIDSDGSSADIRKNYDDYKAKYIKWYKKNVFHYSSDMEESDINEKITLRKWKLWFYLRFCLFKSGKTAAAVDRFLGTKGMARHYFARSQWEFPTFDAYTKLQTFLPLFLPYGMVINLSDYFQRLESLESLQSLERLQSLQSLQSLESLETSSVDYREIKIKPNSVIYCDIPYAETDGYSVEFNHADFYEWCRKQTELTFVSEYVMPDDFVCIAEFEKSSLLSGGGGHKVIEKVFIPAHQLELYQQRCGLLISC